MTRFAVCALVALSASWSACGSNEKAPAPGDGEVTISVAPYSLPGVGFVCYDMAVTTKTDTVWTKGDPWVSFAQEDTETICSDEFGNNVGGDVVYVGPCDAQAG